VREYAVQGWEDKRKSVGNRRRERRRRMKECKGIVQCKRRL
jgi:hypothetical protein